LLLRFSANLNGAEAQQRTLALKRNNEP